MARCRRGGVVCVAVMVVLVASSTRLQPAFAQDAPGARGEAVHLAGSRDPAFIVLDRSRLNYGAEQGGVVTSAQSLLISNHGDVVLDWTASADQTWISLSRSSGTGSYHVDVTVDPSGVAPGDSTGTITVADPAAANSPQTVDVFLRVYATGTTSAPFGGFDTPSNGSVVSGSVPVTGWALDDIEVVSVEIYAQEAPGGSQFFVDTAMFVKDARPDVQAAFPEMPRASEAGWGYRLATYSLPNGGNGEFVLEARMVDGEGTESSLGTKTITCDNASAVKPFGDIEAPSSGQTISGSGFVISGWVLTPQPNTIPTDGSTIEIRVDGVPIGNPTYNIYQPSIATIFPGYNNSDGAGFYLSFDTTDYENGTHTIAAIVTDNAGNTQGIGSNFFTISNQGSQVPVELLEFAIE